MPRRPPARLRTGTPARPNPHTKPRPTIDGLPAGAQFAILRLERTRGYLRPGEVSEAVRLWRDHMRRPARQLWHDEEWGNPDWDCCGAPFDARALLDTVLQALPPHPARALRAVITHLDSL